MPKKKNAISASRRQYTPEFKTEAVPTIDEIDVDAFREDIVQQYRADEVGIRRAALDRFIAEIRLWPGKARLTYAYKAAEGRNPEPYQLPEGPPYAPKIIPRPVRVVVPRQRVPGVHAWRKPRIQHKT